MVEQAGKGLLLIVVVGLGGLRSSQHEGKAPKGQHQSKAVALKTASQGSSYTSENTVCCAIFARATIVC